MPQKIDWDAVAAKGPGSATSAVSPGTGIDWDAIAKDTGTTQNETSDAFPGWKPSSRDTIGPQEHPVAGRVQKIIGDIKYGPNKQKDVFGNYVDTSPEAKIMRGVGFPGIERGTNPNISSMMPGAGAVLGPAELIHAGTEIPQIRDLSGIERIAHEAIQGGFHTLGGVAPFVAPAALPAMVPALTLGGIGNAVAKKATEPFVSPETSDLAGDVGAMLGGGALAKGEPVGKLIERAAPAVGKTAGYGAATFGLMKTHNPLDLLFASKPVTKAGEAITAGIGRGFQQVGRLGKNLIDIPKPEETPVTRESEETPDPLQLGRGPLITPQAADTGMQVQRAQPVVVRGKGGKMTKQFTAEPTSGQTQFGAEPAWRGPGTEVPGKLIESNEKAQPVDTAPEQPPLIQAQPLTKEPESSIIKQGENSVTEESPVIPGDFSLIRPTSFYHGSEANLVDTGIHPSPADHSRFPEGSNPENYTGVYLTPDVNSASEYGSRVHQITLPAKTLLRPDIDQRGSFLTPNKVESNLIKPIDLDQYYNYGINPPENELSSQGKETSSVENQPKDLDEKQLQADLRDKLIHDEALNEENNRQDFYKNNKPDIGKTTGRRYNPDTETLFPWAETPWKSVRR